MDTRPAHPSASMLAGPASLWRLAERRSRKAGSGNIFSNVNLWQLQRLFRAAGDQDAEQRAQLVWGHRDEAELAQALIGLRARSHRRGLRTNGRDVLGSHCDPEAQSNPEASRHTSAGTTGRETGAKMGLTESQSPAGTSERPARTSSGLRRGGENNPERYLHRILH
uniref:Arginine vasopressin-induced protein 1 n=1 Tax=Stegastes partitus TaxID=144197 RepID=A0A3B5ACX4_9TELE